MTDDLGLLVATSSTDKQLCIFESESGQLLAKANCGELTTGMCFSQNGRHLITTSSIGVIYIWKLPDTVTRILNRQPMRSHASRSTGGLLDQIDEDENEDTLKRSKQQNADNSVNDSKINLATSTN